MQYLILYAPAPSSWPMPERLASKSCTKPDSITSSVRGNFSAQAMVTTLKAHGAMPVKVPPRCPAVLK